MTKMEVKRVREQGRCGKGIGALFFNYGLRRVYKSVLLFLLLQGEIPAYTEARYIFFSGIYQEKTLHPLSSAALSRPSIAGGFCAWLAGKFLSQSSVISDGPDGIFLFLQVCLSVRPLFLV